MPLVYLKYLRKLTWVKPDTDMIISENAWTGPDTDLLILIVTSLAPQLAAFPWYFQRHKEQPPSVAQPPYPGAFLRHGSRSALPKRSKTNKATDVVSVALEYMSVVAFLRFTCSTSRHSYRSTDNRSDQFSAVSVGYARPLPERTVQFHSVSSLIAHSDAVTSTWQTLASFPLLNEAATPCESLSGERERSAAQLPAPCTALPS